ncbi:short-chain dehydrogenase, putative [Leishmania panamensis]|uniref:Short-chain dehydrogenase, putative n=1 Tax=Leishmania panamensis TaxID=5679 RepID=A0A088S294_LEIPA|nr:short-chain dehydrogenase, putative [Leishmania panamensis]AIO02379.1 short-chain dehydrogenase, putative [Leishmania panamensis]
MILLALTCGTLWVIWSIVSFFMYRPRKISGATVVVTGACSEMGRRLCMQLYARGARVIAWDYSKIKLQELQADVLKATEGVESADAASAQGDDRIAGSVHSGTFAVMVVDVSSQLQVQRAAKELDGPLDMIVHAAHAYPFKRLCNRTDDSAERIIQTNLLSPLTVVRQLLPLMLSTSCSSSNASVPLKATQRVGDYAQVVNLVAAASSYTLSSDSPEYAASQWGMVGMHYSMREWISQQRSEYMTGGGNDALSEKKLPAAAATRARQPVREVRTTLLCLNEIQYRVPTIASSFFSSSSGKSTAVLATPSSSIGSSEHDGGDGSGARGRSTSTYRSPCAQLMQKRNAELDKAAVCCVKAICRGQERYCHTSPWATTVIYPLLMVCPVPWATRLLRWMQHMPTATAVAEN